MYIVRVTCAKCGRASKFESTDKVRTCPLCRAPMVAQRIEIESIPRSKEAPRVRDDRTWSL